MTLLFFYLALALGVSFLCSILEAVLLSITPSYISMHEQRGSRAGHHLRRLKGDIDRPLAALLSLNTVAHTVGAAGVGAQAHVVFGSGYVAITSAVLTLLILVISEIIPKTIGASYWRELAPAAAVMLRGMVVGLYPLVALSMTITRLLARESNTTFSREEFGAMAEQGAQEGVFHDEESRIFRNLLRFGSLHARDILTPRVVMTALSEDDTVSQAYERLRIRRFSRLPVYREESENITGFVLLNDILLAVAEDRHDQTLTELRRDIYKVPDSLSLFALFRGLLERREHMALVVDEYGGVVGLATLEDIVETLLGLEIMDERDRIEDMRKLARRRWHQRARALGLIDEDSDLEDL
ncbi:MAG: hemolysin family protein [Halofilum sp. (in: g-proteobacteria)]